LWQKIVSGYFRYHQFPDKKDQSIIIVDSITASGELDPKKDKIAERSDILNSMFNVDGFVKSQNFDFRSL
jgi:hypothetical protein